MILDTCALLWLAEGGGRLSDAALARIAAEPVVRVSAITGFEIGLKVARRKLTLPVPASEWLDAVVAHHRLAMVPLDMATCVAATELPPIHADPCDRFIIAAARHHHWPIVTADRMIARYDVEVIG